LKGVDLEAIRRFTGAHALCVAAVCRTWRRAYDAGEINLLPYLEPASRAQLAQAVGHVGLIGALRRISGRRTEDSGTGGW
jgi:hypothetical protein